MNNIKLYGSFNAECPVTLRTDKSAAPLVGFYGPKAEENALSYLGMQMEIERLAADLREARERIAFMEKVRGGG